MTCATCGAERIPANLILTDAGPICPECAYRAAEHAWTHQTLDRPTED